MDAQAVAKALVDLGEAWAKGRRIDRKFGIEAMVDLLAEGEIEMYEEGGQVWCCLPGQKPQHQAAASRALTKRAASLK